MEVSVSEVALAVVFVVVEVLRVLALGCWALGIVFRVVSWTPSQLKKWAAIHYLGQEALRHQPLLVMGVSLKSVCSCSKMFINRIFFKNKWIMNTKGTWVSFIYTRNTHRYARKLLRSVNLVHFVLCFPQCSAAGHRSLLLVIVQIQLGPPDLHNYHCFAHSEWPAMAEGVLNLYLHLHQQLLANAIDHSSWPVGLWGQ